MKVLKSSYVKMHVIVFLLVLLFSVASSYLTYIFVRDYYESQQPEVRYVPVIVYKNRTIPIYGESNFSIVEMISENLTLVFADKHALLEIRILFINITETYFYFNLVIRNRTMWFKMWPKNILHTFGGVVKLERNETTYIAPFHDKRVLSYSFTLGEYSLLEVVVQEVKIL